MAFSLGLLAKGLVGVLSVGTPIAVCVYYKDDILGTNKSKVIGEKTDGKDQSPGKATTPEGGGTSDNNQKNTQDNGSTTKGSDAQTSTEKGNSDDSAQVDTSNPTSGKNNSSDGGVSGSENS